MIVQHTKDMTKRLLEFPGSSATQYGQRNARLPAARELRLIRVVRGLLNKLRRLFVLSISRNIARYSKSPPSVNFLELSLSRTQNPSRPLHQNRPKCSLIYIQEKKQQNLTQDRPWYVSVPIEIWCLRGKSLLGLLAGLLIGCLVGLLGTLPSRVLKATVRGVMGVMGVIPNAGERGVCGILSISYSNFLSSK